MNSPLPRGRLAGRAATSRLSAAVERTDRSQAVVDERRNSWGRRGEDCEIRGRLEFYRSIIDASPQAVIALSPDGIIQFWSRGAEDLFGFSEQEMCNRSFRSFWTGESEPPCFSKARRWETTKRHRDGTSLALSVESAPLHDDDGSVAGVVWTVCDIGERLRLELERNRREAGLREDALTDPLTKVMNRRGVLEALKAEYSRAGRAGTPLTLVFADLDNFKAINDDFGHVVGDLALQAFAALVQSHLRSHDVLARWGGDEFVILMPDTNREDAARCIERIREVVQSVSLPCLTRRLTASFGICQHAPDETLESQIRRADRALYRAKHGGRNCAVNDDLPAPGEQDSLMQTKVVASSQQRGGDGKRRPGSRMRE